MSVAQAVSNLVGGGGAKRNFSTHPRTYIKFFSFVNN